MEKTGTFDAELSSLLSRVLESLASTRLAAGRWSDAEEESAGTQVFKVGEALRPFLFAGLYPVRDQQTSFLPQQLLFDDTRWFLSTIKKDGFFPSPYSPVDSKDQYTDFASFCLEFTELLQRGLTAPADRALARTAADVQRKALQFIMDPAHYVQDESGVRWAGTSTHTLKLRGRVPQLFTDTYFTSVVVVALTRMLDSQGLHLKTEEQDDIRRLITQSCRWIASRERRGLLTGDEDKTRQQLFYTAWGLRALVEAYDLLGADEQNVVKAVALTFIETLAEHIVNKGVSITQDYLYICSTDLKTGLPYDERSGWGGFLLSLLAIGAVPGLESALEDSRYLQVLDSVVAGLLALRHPTTDLWYKEFFILSIHWYLVEALALLARGPRRLGYSFEVTSAIVFRSVREMVADPRIAKAVEEVLYEKLRQLALVRDQQRRFSSQFTAALEEMEYQGSSARAQAARLPTSSRSQTKVRNKRRRR